MKPGIGGKRTAVRGIVGIWVALVGFDVVVNIGCGLVSLDGGVCQGGISGVIEIKVKVNFNITDIFHNSHVEVISFQYQLHPLTYTKFLGSGIINAAISEERLVNIVCNDKRLTRVAEVSLGDVRFYDQARIIN